jgi:hypothetical protein
MTYERTVDKNPIGIGMEIAEEEKNSEWSTVDRRSNRKGKRTSPERKNSPTVAELRNSQVLENEYTRGNLPKKTKPNNSRTDLGVNNEVEINVEKGTENNEENNAIPEERNIETCEGAKHIEDCSLKCVNCKGKHKPFNQRCPLIIKEK